MPTDLEQATGLERMELLGRMQGIDIFNSQPLDASRLGSSTPPLLPILPQWFVGSYIVGKQLQGSDERLQMR